MARKAGQSAQTYFSPLAPPTGKIWLARETNLRLRRDVQLLGAGERGRERAREITRQAKCTCTWEGSPLGAPPCMPAGARIIASSGAGLEEIPITPRPSLCFTGPPSAVWWWAPDLGILSNLRPLCCTIRT